MLFIFSRISARAMQLSQMLQQLASAVPAHAEFLRLEAELAAHDAPKTRPAPAIGLGAIVFRDVSFHDLLLGLLEPDAGEITVGAAVIRSTAAIKWRDHVSYVVQDPYMFRDTIRRNLLWANPQANDAGIWDALAIAAVDDFVAGLAAGLDTVLGERGTLISGGDRQRLCLARAVLRRPFLFVLDEATSAIDVPAERKIIKAMLDLKLRPIVIIAHRDQSLASCDHILRLQNGRAMVDEPALNR
jgi:ATP-binding cassette subfamily C protein